MLFSSVNFPNFLLQTNRYGRLRGHASIGIVHAPAGVRSGGANSHVREKDTVSVSSGMRSTTGDRPSFLRDKEAGERGEAGGRDCCWRGWTRSDGSDGWDAGLYGGGDLELKIVNSESGLVGRGGL